MLAQSCNLPGNQRLAVHRSGDGPCLVLLHGVGASRWDFEALLPELAGYRCWVPDLPGHGDSAQLGPYDPASFAKLIWQALDAQQIPTPVLLLGHSMGGAVAQEMALLRPAQVRALMLLDTLPSFKPNSIKKWIMLWWRRFAMRFLGPVRLSAIGAQRMLPGPDHVAARAALAARNARTPQAVYLALMQSLPRWDIRSKLSQLTMPCLVLAGDQDYFPAAEAIAFAQQLPKAECHILAGGHHHLPIEHPRWVAEQVKAFLHKQLP